MRDRETAKAELAKLIRAIEPDVKPIVMAIEASRMTTRNHYDRYITVINTVSRNNRNMAKVVALAMIQCGANKQGVHDALRICIGE